MYPVFGLWIPPGKKMWVDEKQAAIYVEAGHAEIIERPAPVFNPKLSKR